jgi:hypothetical protein
VVARTLPYKSRDKPPPEPLPSISEEIQQAQADPLKHALELDKVYPEQAPVEQLRHAQEQLDLTKSYPGRAQPRE